MKNEQENRWLALGLLAVVFAWVPACDESEDSGPTGGTPALGTSAAGAGTPDAGDDDDGEDSGSNDSMAPDDDGADAGTTDDGMGEGSTGAQDESPETSTSGDEGESTGSGDDDPGDPSDSGIPNPVQECLDTASDSCQECGCNSCLAEFGACEADIGCVVIRICTENAMCSGVDCLGPCGDVINDNGGAFGEPLATLITLGDCMDAACDGCQGG